MRSHYAIFVLFEVIEFLRFSTYKTSITLLQYFMERPKPIRLQK